MITKDNLLAVLKTLGFTQEQNADNTNLYKKHFDKSNCEILIHFEKDKNDKILQGKITYPEELEASRETTKDFHQDENFVVLECVCRLLEKGYKPQNIVLEQDAVGGHGLATAYLDILVRDNNDEPYLLIECKTAGTEFEKAWKKMLIDGGQLFNYFNSFLKAKYLCLYASDFIEDKLNYNSYIIQLEDNKDYLAQNKKLKSFESCKGDTKEAYFKVWKETYGQDYSTQGIFEDDIAPFTVGKKNFSIDDLHEVNYLTIQKKYNEFATIMRQHNVGSHENAFDKLVNLFLAKIVDETNNPKELKFYWKGAAYDDYFNFQDRLQKMYSVGMEKFLGESVTYIDNEKLIDAFKLFKNDPDATKDKVLDYFRQLKFYTNNDFSFLDVHNEQLFLQNAVILRKTVQMLQDIKLKTNSQNQFLGDLFEGFLDQGVKQSEGQFFTPMPIVKFLVSSLPLENIITDSTDIPKAIDYACGAGHFLNEYASAIKSIVQEKKNVDIKNYYSEIYGIEKEYRLSKVAKVSAFMYGQDDINIHYGDALANNTKIKDASFSVLIANPPYSVKGFLETLTEEERDRYTLTKEVNNISSNNSIETFFIERAGQLLKDGGVAAIILPSSVLSNGNIYSKTRKIILEKFDIIAIAELGAGTFGKTGTTTVTLFLRRKKENPSLAENAFNRVNAWFNSDFTKDVVFEDSDILKSYCEFRGFNLSDYKTLLQKYPNNQILQNESIKDYEKTFDARWKNGKSDTKGLNENAKIIRDSLRKKTNPKPDNKNRFKSLSQELQDKEIKKAFIEFITEIEKEKLYIFVLTKTVKNSVLIITSCSNKKNKKEIKEFLGYEWSDKKGDEGIKYLNIARKKGDDGEAVDDDTLAQVKGIEGIKTPLFDPKDFNNETKINTLIRKNFLGVDFEIPESLCANVTKANLYDMLDFSRTTFNKAIKLNVDKKVEIQSKWDLVKLGEVAEIIRGVTYSKKEQVNERTKNIILTADNITLEGNFEVTKEIFLQDELELDEKKKLHKNDCFMCFSSGSKNHIGKICFIEKNTNYFAGGFMGILRAKEEILPYYLFNIMNSLEIRQNVINSSSGSNINNLSNSLEYVKIPLPPLDIQQKIVTECSAIDTNAEQNKTIIEETKKQIEDLYNQLDEKAKTSGEKYKLTNSDIFEISIGKRVLATEVNDNFEIPVFSANVFEPFGKINKLLITDFSNDSVLWGIDGDWMVNYIEKETQFYPTDHCGVLRLKSDKINTKYMAHLLEITGKAEKFSRTYRASIDRIQGLTVAVPSLADQQKIIEQITALEQKIATAKTVLEQAPSQKQQVLKKWL